MAKNKKVADASSLKQLVLSNTKTSGATPEIASNNDGYAENWKKRTLITKQINAGTYDTASGSPTVKAIVKENMPAPKSSTVSAMFLLSVAFLFVSIFLVNSYSDNGDSGDAVMYKRVFRQVENPDTTKNPDQVNASVLPVQNSVNKDPPAVNPVENTTQVPMITSVRNMTQAPIIIPEDACTPGEIQGQVQFTSPNGTMAFIVVGFGTQTPTLNISWTYNIMTDTAVYPQRKISLYYFRRNQDILDEGPRTLVNTDGDIGPRETSYVWTIPDVLDGEYRIKFVADDKDTELSQRKFQDLPCIPDGFPVPGFSNYFRMINNVALGKPKVGDFNPYPNSANGISLGWISYFGIFFVEFLFFI